LVGGSGEDIGKGNSDRLPLEVRHAGIDKLDTEIFFTKSGRPVGSFALEDTFLNVEKKKIESSSSEIEGEDVLFLSGLFIKTVGNSGSGWLVNDFENVNTRDSSGILGRIFWLTIENTSIHKSWPSSFWTFVFAFSGNKS
jgi:hypothetical protein